ncbi:MAG: hypothetical protein WBP82_11130 [Leuconostoc mesenteroides]
MKTLAETKYKTEKLALDFKFVELTLTFEDFEPWKFTFYRQGTDEVKKSKEAFFALSDEEQKLKVVPHRIEQLSALLARKPENVPEVSDTEDYKQAFIKFFTKNEDIMGWLWSAYQTKLYPKELL